VAAGGAGALAAVAAVRLLEVACCD